MSTHLSAQSKPSRGDAAAKLAALRASMQTHRLDAYLVPSSDEHLNEYLPDNTKRREFVSGFTGSAGDCVIGLEEAVVFADSRYYEQAETEVDTRCFRISKVGLEGHPTLTEVLVAWGQGKTSFTVGFDPATLSVEQFRQLEARLKQTAITLMPVAGNLIDGLWGEARPSSPAEPVFTLPEAITGESVAQKLGRVRSAMAAQNVHLLPVTKLDQVAWLFNLRGQDIPYNPVFLAYALVTPKEALLFKEASRLEASASKALRGLAEVLPYEAYGETLAAYVGKTQDSLALVDPSHSAMETLTRVQAAGGQVLESATPLSLMKALKNDIELAGMREANLKASRAKIRALAWLSQQIQNPPYTTKKRLKPGEGVTEESFRLVLEGFYAEEADYFGLSFNTIAGAGANSSIVHYGTPDPQKSLQPGELFLIDSGVQFRHGTTDDTRTVVMGSPTALQRKRYTEVLKAHINCAMQRFPKGTEGARLDGVTRASMWQAGLDYGHGTGHGVGAFLNVHEGPNGIHRMAKEPLQPGMITSIEPGFYEPGWGGIRIENLYAVQELPGKPYPDGRPCYGFETLTFVPFEKRLINKNALSPAQLRWLKAYHQAIFKRLAPTLSKAEAAWLKRACQIGL